MCSLYSWRLTLHNTTLIVDDLSLLLPSHSIATVPSAGIYSENYEKESKPTEKQQKPHRSFLKLIKKIS